MDVTKEQIKQWKAKYKEVFVLRVDDKVAYLRTPDRATLSYASTLATKDPMKFNEAILTNCWLGGDEEIKTDDALFLSASSKLGELIQIKEATLEKLKAVRKLTSLGIGCVLPMPHCVTICTLPIPMPSMILSGLCE